MYDPPKHDWKDWAPKGPARRYTPYEIFLMTLGGAVDVLVDIRGIQPDLEYQDLPHVG